MRRVAALAVVAVLSLTGCDPLTAATTGPTVSSPPTVPAVNCGAGQTINLTDVVVSGVFLNAGCAVTLTRVRVTGSVVVLPRVGGPLTKLHVDRSAIHEGMTVNIVDSSGNLYWGGPVDVDVKVANSWIHTSQGDGTYHTEALAGFGIPRGTRWYGNTFVQDGPFNATATGVINWTGENTAFVGNNFLYDFGVAAYFSIYLRGTNNVFHNNAVENGLAWYVYPNEPEWPVGVYTANRDAETGEEIDLP